MRILIDTGATSCYIRKGVYDNGQVLAIKKRVRTIHGSTVIDLFHNVHLLGCMERFYEIDNLESDFLIGVNFLRKIRAKIDMEKELINYGNEYSEKLRFLSNNEDSCIGKSGTILKSLGHGSPKAPAEGNTGNIKEKNENSKKECFGNTKVIMGQNCLMTPADELYQHKITNKELTLEEETSKAPAEDHSSNMLNNFEVENLEMRNKFSKKYEKNIGESEGFNIPLLREDIIRIIKETHKNIDMDLPFRTDIKAEIRTEDDKPIWSKQYPYPVSVNNFVNEEIGNLLRKGIIRNSKSPYNSPVWVVPKKGMNEDGSPKLRLVIDFKKLNEKTISDRYPMPNPEVILSNLGESKYFSTIDLESGFHQILMQEGDIEKTAFSVNNGKYEYLRMPFGLRNAPSIFQRAMNDILREYIGKFCQVYIDDIIIFSKTLTEHIQQLKQIVERLREAHMKISLEKSRFIETEVEFLGYVVSHKVIKTDPKKVEAIKNYPIPKTLRQLRGFLGLTGYYRKFIQDYATIAKPLTKHLKGKNGGVSQHVSKKTRIDLDQEGIAACERLKDVLCQCIELSQPDFNEKLILNTDASNVAVGAVLSQRGKPITFISKTLNSTEQNYATNEKELYAIVWALKTLRHYLYAVKDLEIYTDHQPLSFAISERNPNVKMKRWRAFIEEFSPRIIYKPGATNVVADALSRQQLNNLTESNNEISESEDSFANTQHSAESSDEISIRETNKPLNHFKQQILINQGAKITTQERVLIFGNTRFLIEYDKPENIIPVLSEQLNPKLVTGIFCTPEVAYEIKTVLMDTFPVTKFLRVKCFPIDVTNREDQGNIIEQTHGRAHRNYRENLAQIRDQYYWPQMVKQFKQYVRNCQICNKNKYDRQPKKVPIGRAPIPEKEGEQIHIDIFYAQKLKFLTLIDSYSKFLIVKHIEDKTNLIEKILEALQVFPEVKRITVDNEPSFASAQFRSFANRCNIEIYYCDPRHSVTNGQVERVHSTLIEIGRCLKEELNLISDLESIIRAAQQYNKTIHSTIKEKPYEVLYNKKPHENIKDKLKSAQEVMLKVHNKRRKEKNYTPCQTVYEKVIGERNKLKPKYRRQKVKEDRGNKIIIQKRDRIIHKDNIKS